MRTKSFFTIILLGLLTISSFSQEIEWKSKAMLPHAIYSGSAVTCQERIFFLGGQIDMGSAKNTPSKHLYEYDLAKDKWIKKTDMPTASHNTAVTTVDGEIYAIGGDRFLDKNQMYLSLIHI